MSEPSLHLVEELFHEAVGMDPGQRTAFLEARCTGTRTSERRSKNS